MGIYLKFSNKLQLAI